MKWFRLYHSLIDSVDVRKLQPSAQLDYVLLLCLASEHREKTGANDGSTGRDLVTAAWRARSETMEANAPALFDAGLIRLDGNAQLMVTGWSERQVLSDDGAIRARAYRERKSLSKQRNETTSRDASRYASQPVTVRVTGEKEKEKEKKDDLNYVEIVPGESAGASPQAPKLPESPPTLPDCPHTGIVRLYHECLPDCQKVKIWDDRRKALLRSRWRHWATEGKYASEAEGLAWWRRFFVYVGKSPFLTGKVPCDDRAPFVASLEWLLKPANHAKVVEGQYHNRKVVAAKGVVV